MPAVTGTFTGPSTAAVCPASVTFAGTEPAGTSSACGGPLARPLITLLLPAYTSTAGASATCRTTRRPLPVPAALVSLANAVRTGVPDAVKPATTVAFSPAVTCSVADTTGALAAAEPALRTAIA